MYLGLGSSETAKLWIIGLCVYGLVCAWAIYQPTWMCFILVSDNQRLYSSHFPHTTGKIFVQMGA